MKLLACILAVMVVAAGPATKPTTMPSLAIAAYDVLKQRESSLAEAKLLAAKAASDCVSAVQATPAYKAKAETAKELKDVLDRARASGTPQDRASASAAYLKASGELRTIEFDAVAKDAATKDAKSKVANAEAEYAAARDDLTNAQEKDRQQREGMIEADPILSGIKHGKLAVGMTLEQAQKAMKTEGKKKYENANGISEYRFSKPEFMGEGRFSRTYYLIYVATFENGKITSIQDLGSSDTW